MVASSVDHTASTISLQAFAFAPAKEDSGGTGAASLLRGNEEGQGGLEDRFTPGSAQTASTYPDLRSVPQGVGPQAGENEKPGNAGEAPSQKGLDGEPVTEEEQRELEALKKREREVKAHEQAHMAAGAGLVRGGAKYTYERGPDGRMYAVSGEVSIDTSEGRTPEETIRKMERVKRAALAPAEPSAKDRQVAAGASRIQAEGRAELAEEQREELNQSASGAEKTPAPNPQGVAGAYEWADAGGGGTLGSSASVLDIFM